MKKLLQVLTIATLLLASTTSWAHGPYYRGYNPYGWVAPAVIGGALGYAIAARPPVVYVQPSPTSVYYPPYQPVQQPPYGYHYQNIYDGYCQCNRVVLVPNY